MLTLHIGSNYTVQGRATEVHLVVMLEEWGNTTGCIVIQWDIFVVLNGSLYLSEVLTRKICLTIKTFSFFLDAGHSKAFKGLTNTLSCVCICILQPKYSLTLLSFHSNKIWLNCFLMRLKIWHKRSTVFYKREYKTSCYIKKFLHGGLKKEEVWLSKIIIHF